MDIVAHSLWAAAGIAVLARREPIPWRTIAATIGLAALPDVVHLLPLVAWWLFGDASVADLKAYAMALPGQEPAMPAWVAAWSHHLHCVMHSALVAGAVTWVARRGPRSLRIALLGGWSHIVIDVFTHSAEYYPAPVLYPITQRGFDGIAWNTPWFMAVNYLALAAVFAWLAFGPRSRPAR